tara:strand:+ start:4364 stop:4468 length:105 start_codon:yes stop_codon:yes gene_type:complete
MIPLWRAVICGLSAGGRAKNRLFCLVFFNKSTLS